MRFGILSTGMLVFASACLLSDKSQAGDRPTTGQQARADNAEYLPDLGVSVEGTRVIALLPGTPAARAGLRVGDEIRQVGTDPVTTSQELRATIGQQRSDSVAEIRIERQHQLHKLKVWIVRETATPSYRRRLDRVPPQRTAYESNYRPLDDRGGQVTVRGKEVRGSVADEDYVNSGLDTARRYVDPNSDVVSRTRRGERELDRAQRAFDRNTNRLAEKAGSPQEFDKPFTPEPPGYHVVVPGDLSGPRMSQGNRGPEQYYGRPGASGSERGDYPIPGDKGGISRDRRQVTASEAYTPDRAGRTSAEDRTTRLVDEFSTHVDRQNGRPDRLTGENDSRVHPQGPYTRPAAPGRAWYPDASGGGTALPGRWPYRGNNPPNEGNDPRAGRNIYQDLNRETTDYWH